MDRPAPHDQEQFQMGPPQARTASPETVREALEKVLTSTSFTKSPRLSRFLRFTVEQTLQGRRDFLKEYVLGLEVFDRGQGYDPQTDPVVRVQAGRLRMKLQQYYQSEGAQDPLIFEFSKGNYTPVFRKGNLVERPAKNDSNKAIRSGRNQMVWLAGALVVASTIAYLSGRSSSRSRASSPTAASIAGVPTGTVQASVDREPSIAVLPFEDQSPQRDQAYFCDGMTETLIDALTKVDGIRVAARASVLSFRGKPSDLGSIAAKLHVGLVVQGSVRREDSRLRVVAQLVDVSNGLNVWSEIYNRQTGDVFAVQDEIASAIAGALKSQIGRPQAGQQLAKMYTRNADAYLSYLKGHYHLAGLTRPEIEKGLLYLEQATDEDPNYALAYAGLAEGYSLLADDNFSPPREVMPKAEAAARRALALDDSLAEAHAVLGLVESTYKWDWQSADREFRRAIALNPKYASAYQWYGLTCLASTGRGEEALAAIGHAQKLDPISTEANTNLASVLLRLGRYDDAIRIYTDTIDLDPNFFWAYRDLGLALCEKHAYRESIRALERADSVSHNNPAVLAALGYCYARTGNVNRAQDILRRLKELSNRSYVPPYHVAAVYAGLGDKQNALDWLDRAYQDRSTWMNGIRGDPLFDSLRAEPRFIQILKRMGLG
jgi:serine/threonine-protein kinase